jgi:hypothetical protein
MKTLLLAAGILGLAATGALAQTPPPPPGPGSAPQRLEHPRADANGDGKITWAEFSKAAADRFARRDINKDGRLTQDEMQAGRGGGRRMHPGMGRRGAMMFHRADINDDGVVTREEAERAAKRLFTFLDANEDGVLSGKELPRRGMGHGHRDGRMAPGGPMAPPETK